MRPSWLRKFVLLVAVFTIFISASAQDLGQENEDDSQPDQLKVGEGELQIECNSDIPYLSVGEIYEDPDMVKKEYKAFIVSISQHEECEACCGAETMLAKISDLSADGTFHYKDRTVPILRLDAVNNQSLIESENLVVNRIPKTYIYIKGEYYEYQEIDNSETFLNFADRVFNPIVTLKSKLDVEKFRTEFNDDIAKNTRVIAFISDRSEYRSELKDLHFAARKLSFREDLRVAKIVDSRIVKDIKTKYKSWFSNSDTAYSSSNVLISFMKNQDSEQVFTHSYDLSMDDQDFVGWINDISLAPLEELSLPSLKIMTLKSKPIFTAYVDTKDPKFKVDSKELLKNLKSVAEAFPQFYMTYTEDPTLKEMKSKAGIDFDEEPALALNPVHQTEENIVFPRKQPFTKKNLKYFFKSIWEGTVHSDSFKLPDLIRNFDKNMKDAVKLNLNNLDEFLSRDVDKYVLVFDATDDYKKMKDLTKMFGKTALRFKELELSPESIQIAFFDSSLQDVPQKLSAGQSGPFLRMFPKGKEALEPEVVDRTGVQKMMKHVQKHATNQFELPKYPHFSPHEYSQDSLGAKIKYEHVVEAENKRKEADADFEERVYGSVDDLGVNPYRSQKSKAQRKKEKELENARIPKPKPMTKQRSEGVSVIDETKYRTDDL